MNELEKDNWYYFTLPSEGDTWYPVWISDNNECVLDGKRIKLTKLEGMIFEKAVMPKAPTCTANERKFLDEIREKGEWVSGKQIQVEHENMLAILNQRMFKANLRELVNE